MQSMHVVRGILVWQRNRAIELNQFSVAR